MGNINIIGCPSLPRDCGKRKSSSFSRKDPYFISPEERESIYQEEWFDALQFFDESDEETNGDTTTEPSQRPENDETEESTFHVSQNELEILKRALEESFPTDCDILNDAYIVSVASKPYSKNMSQRRPLEYSKKKLFSVMEWRHQKNASKLGDLLALENNGMASDAATDASDASRARKLVASINNASLYFHGLTQDGRPILWMRGHRLPWFPDVDGQMDALLLMCDVAVRCGMPDGCTDFVAICHCSGAPPPHPRFALNLVSALTRGFPDRVQSISAAPIGRIVDAFLTLVSPLVPKRLLDKLVLLTEDKCRVHLTNNLLLNGKDDLPTFLGGPNADHETYYPEPKNAPNRGRGTLTFDFYGMKERLTEERRKFEAAQSNHR